MRTSLIHHEGLSAGSPSIGEASRCVHPPRWSCGPDSWHIAVLTFQVILADEEDVLVIARDAGRNSHLVVQSLFHAFNSILSVGEMYIRPLADTSPVGCYYLVLLLMRKKPEKEQARSPTSLELESWLCRALSNRPGLTKMPPPRHGQCHYQGPPTRFVQLHSY
jgi:hypothetical protein